jgi:transposase
MSYELQRFATTLLSPTAAVHLDKVTVEQETVWLELTATARHARCPCCTVLSSSVHSRYQRCLTDLPWGTPAVRIQLTVRKFVCQNPSCERHIFTERLPTFVAAYARKTQRLVTALRTIGMALGGQAGARLAAHLRLPASPATLLRLMQAAPLPQTPALQAVGVDEWAWRRGHRYGTILVNLVDHRVVDLLPDRSAANVAAWLGQHPTITTVCRDRSDLYADGILRGEPQAVQVVDRFHLVQNLHQALETFLIDRRPVPQAAAVGTALAKPRQNFRGLCHAR